jgi:hypothetical protein
MRKKAVHIVLALWVLLLGVSCSKGPKRIPRDEMLDIFSEMFFLDEMVRYDQVLRKQADTLLVYEGVFRRHGYNTDDYVYSVECYLRDPERMAKMMDEVADRMYASAQALNGDIAIFDWQQEMLSLYKKPVSDKLPQPSCPECWFKQDYTLQEPYSRFLPVVVPREEALVLKNS